MKSEFALSGSGVSGLADPTYDYDSILSRLEHKLGRRLRPLPIGLDNGWFTNGFVLAGRRGGWIRKSLIHSGLRTRQMGSFGRRRNVGGRRGAGGRGCRMPKIRRPGPGENEAGARDRQE